jgi:dipeptidyl aminopeptidase/acylaminoacyl peptidase
VTRLSAFVFAWLAACVAMNLPAASYRPGATIDPADGNGLLAVDIDALAPISAVRIEHIGSVFGGTTLTRLQSGTNVRLVELPAGDYRWSRIDFADRTIHQAVGDDARFRFTIEPGIINYVGDLCIAPAGYGGRHHISVTNRAARMLIHLDRAYPGARRKYPMRYQGAFPDRFLPFAANELGDQLATDALKSGSVGEAKNPPDDAALRALVGELFAPRPVQLARMNPRGDLVALVGYADGKNRISLFDTGSQRVVDVYRGDAEVRKLYFSADRTLLFELDGPAGSHVVHAQTRSGGAPVFTQYAIPGRGWFIDPTLAGGSQALYALIDGDGDEATHIFRIDLDSRRFDRSQLSRERRLDVGLDKAFFGLADGSGTLRLALTLVKGDYAMMHRPDAASPWHEVQRYAADEVFEPVSLSNDGASVVALTNKGRTQTDLVRIALPSGQIAETLYSIPGTDLDGVLTRNRDRSVLGLRVWRDGNLETSYLDEPDDAMRSAVARVFPGKRIAIYDTNAQHDRMLVLASDEVDPGSFYLYDATSTMVQALAPVGTAAPHVHPVRSQVLKASAGDGTAIESYLTLPPDVQPPYPLIVMPHGGPIGIRDGLRFDPEVQLLANRGYAVLRVNYRGSGGFGRAFEQAGLGAWGRSIEDDILAATDAALKAAPLDGGRIALRGSSYGGYSTLMGLIRTPERFRCGVAISAVTDVPLMFTASDWSQDLRSRDRMMQVVGDPATALENMEAVSPDFLYRKLDRPLLVIHGALDARVPLEHALRLLLLLGHARTPPKSLFFAHEGHGIDGPAARIEAESAIDRFYSQCLAPSANTRAAN